VLVREIPTAEKAAQLMRKMAAGTYVEEDLVEATEGSE